MANRNNLPHRNVEDAAESSDENEENPARANDHGPIPLSRPVRDERTIDPQQPTGEQIDGLIRHPPDHPEATIPMANCFIFLLFGFIIYHCWPLFLFLFVAYRLITNNNQPGVNLREFRSRHLNVPIQYIMNPYRDAQAEGRTAQLTEEEIQFVGPIEIVENMPHITVNLNNIQHPIVIINNGDRNNDEIIAPDTQNETNNQVMAHENDVSQTVVDDPTYNINPLGSVESQDDVQSSDSSDEEDLIISSESGFDGDDEADSADDNEQTGPTPPNLSNSIQNNPPSNQTNVVDEQPTITIAPLHNEAVEIPANVTTTAEGAHQIILPFTCLTTGIPIPKTTNRTRPNGESSDEYIS